MALITASNATLSYEGIVAVQNLNFEVNTGNYLCIVGENGSGKTTLIKGLLGLMTPSSGTIVMGDGLTQNEIGFLPQQTSALKDFPASVSEVVLSGRLNNRGVLPFYTRADKLAARESIERFGLTNLQKACFRELSGGQQQRVLLARALCSASKLLILDEPVAGLDPLGTKDLYQIVQDLKHSYGMTIIMVSHDISGVIQYATHVLHVRNDQLFFGETTDYLASPVGKQFSGGQAHV